MKIITSIQNLDLETQIDELHPIRQIEKCEQFKNTNVKITTYSTYIIEWAKINNVEIECDATIQEIYDSLNKVFDILDDMAIEKFTK